MWNYYGATAAGVNVVFDFAWNMFNGSEKTEVTIGEKLSNDIMLFRGLVVYSIQDKQESIKSITINPYDKGSNSMFELGIKNLLWMKGLENVKIVLSNIPIRKYD